MTKEDRQLLLKDLSARLPYGVSLQLTLWKGKTTDCILTGIDEDDNITVDIPADCAFSMECVRPYLRPMNSMTEKEKKKFSDFCVIDEFVFRGNSEIGHKNQAIIMSDGIDYLNSIHIDYRGLISKGLAIEVTEENNPYK